MAELFGFQAGQRLAQKDKLEQQMAELSLQQGQQQLRRGEVQIQQDEVTLDNAKITRDRQLKFLEALKASEGAGLGGTAGTPASGKDLSAQLDDMARLSLEAGLPEQAAKYAGEASQIRNNQSLIKQRDNDQRNRQLNYAAGLLDDVKDEQSWAQANMLYSIEFGEESPFANLPFSPELVEKIKDSVTTQRQKSLIEAAEVKADQADEQLRKIEGQIKLNEARTRLINAREKSLEKAGDKSVIAKPGDVKVITDLLETEYGTAGVAADRRTIALPVAERMLQLQKELQIPRSEAAARAFKEAKDAGEFGGLKERKKTPGTKEFPLSIPKDSKQLKNNMYYVIKEGQYAGKTVLYTGKEFQVVE